MAEEVGHNHVKWTCCPKAKCESILKCRITEDPTVAERGHAFYFHNFQKWSFPTTIISDYEYFSLPKFLNTGFSI